MFESEIDQAQQHFRETAGRPDITAAVVIFKDTANLSREIQNHMADA